MIIMTPILTRRAMLVLTGAALASDIKLLKNV